MDKTIAIVGLGYVGLPLALLADKKGYKVIGIDLNEDKVSKINQRICPFSDDYVANELKTSNLTAVTDFKPVADANIVIICVPTPVYENRLPNYEPVESACREIAPFMKKGQLVVLESTVNPGVSEEIMLPILEKFSGLTCGTDFSLAHCPERINPGDAKWRVHNIPRVVGGYDKQSLETAYEFYSSIIEGQVKKMGSLKEAEAVKVTENSFRNINIAFVNELARSFSKLGIDVVNVIDGAATKPFSFMAHYPGCGIGGHCIPVDPYYLIDYAQKNGFEHEFLKLSCQINEEMPEYTVELMEAELEKKGKMEKGAKVTVLGLAYKANIDDCRESPAIEIIKELNKKGYSVSTYDPHVLSQSTAKSLDEAVEGASAVIVATNHTEFIDGLTPEYLKNKKIEILIDGKNCLNKDAMNETGISYRGIGR